MISQQAYLEKVLYTAIQSDIDWMLRVMQTLERCYEKDKKS